MKVNKQIPKPITDTPSGRYSKSQVISLSCPNEEFIIEYSINNEPFHKYYGPFVLRKTAKVRAVCKVNEEYSEPLEFYIEINKNKPSTRGCVVIIGGAEHCKEIHEKIVELAGGPKNAKIAFIPTSSSEPYASGMDRLTRFRDLAGLQIDKTKVPLINGKYDYSSLENESNFWIVPIAIVNDKNTTLHYQTSPDNESPLIDISTFPNIDESTWIENATHKDLAIKLRDSSYNVIFLTGGNQARYLKCFYYPDWTETPALSIIREILEENGGVVAGTSAGAAALSKIMIMGGGSYGATNQGLIYHDIDLHNYEENYTPFEDEHDGRVWIGKGLGFLPETIITGTHFVQRGRLGRLATAAMWLKQKYGKTVNGIGVGEDTAVVVYPDNKCEVVGSQGVILIDTSKMILEDGIIEKGNFFVDNLLLHYLEHKDTFTIDGITGKIIITGINPDKKEITKEEIAKNKTYYIEPDIFGKNTVKNFIWETLVYNSANDTIGLELIDNLYNSYDTCLFHDLVKDSTVLMRFTETPESKGYKGKLTYHWYGKKDKYYPNIIKEIEERFSYTHINVEIIDLKLQNFPDLSDAENIPLKEKFIEQGGNIDEWYEIFDSYKRTYFGIIVLPTDNKDNFEVRTFFFDYCYHDTDGTGCYSPPRLKPKNSTLKYTDYDIVEIDEAPDTEVFCNNKKIGVTDDFGVLYLNLPEGTYNFKAIYQGKKHKYEVELLNIKLPLNHAYMAFSKKSYY